MWQRPDVAYDGLGLAGYSGAKEELNGRQSGAQLTVPSAAGNVSMAVRENHPEFGSRLPEPW